MRRALHSRAPPGRKRDSSAQLAFGLDVKLFSPHLGEVPRAPGRAVLVCAGLLRWKSIFHMEVELETAI